MDTEAVVFSSCLSKLIHMKYHLAKFMNELQPSVINTNTEAWWCYDAKQENTKETA